VLRLAEGRASAVLREASVPPHWIARPGRYRAQRRVRSRSPLRLRQVKIGYVSRNPEVPHIALLLVRLTDYKTQKRYLEKSKDV
jgi:hypothetical protein